MFDAAVPADQRSGRLQCLPAVTPSTANRCASSRSRARGRTAARSPSEQGEGLVATLEATRRWLVAGRLLELLDDAGQRSRASKARPDAGDALACFARHRADQLQSVPSRTQTWDDVEAFVDCGAVGSIVRWVW